MPAVRAWQRKYLDSFGEQPSRHQPIFIIGAPRSGSTILYQALTNHLDVLYIDNLACGWYEALFFGLWRSHRRFGDAPHDVFVSELGSTVASGKHAPSECGSFWYRWLDRENHFVDHDDVTERMVSGIRREINAAMNYFDKPILIKNLNAGQRLRLLAKCFPGARFIHIQRELEDNVRSLHVARQALGIRKGQWWSVRPKGYEALLRLPEREMLVAQVASIERQIAEDIALFPEGSREIVQYKDLCPETIVGLGHWLGLRPREAGSIPVFELQSKAATQA